nr:XRE family transcriptional regulator [Luoshenia tenuis]
MKVEIGSKIKRMRMQHGLTQQELADRCELSKGFISQLERDLASPSIATLMDILECLGTDLKNFFNEDSAEKVIFSAEDTFIKTNEELGTTIEWLVPNCQKNDMEPILMTLQPGKCTDSDSPHSGEEFGYVLSGTIQVHLGNQRYRARKGDAFYFPADTAHSISNPGKSAAKFLWVSTPPSF